MSCLWKFDDLDGIYESACGKNFFFETGTAQENGFRFCPFCGEELEIANETKPEESGKTLMIRSAQKAKRDATRKALKGV